MSKRAESATPHPRRVRGLDTVADVKREAAGLYRAARRGELAPSDASKLANVLALIARLTEAGEFERRLEAIEEGLARTGKGR